MPPHVRFHFACVFCFDATSQRDAAYGAPMILRFDLFRALFILKYRHASAQLTSGFSPVKRKSRAKENAFDLRGFLQQRRYTALPCLLKSASSLYFNLSPFHSAYFSIYIIAANVLMFSLYQFHSLTEEYERIVDKKYNTEQQEFIHHHTQY